MFDELKVINYPDPRLRKKSARVERFDERLKKLMVRMLELMREHKGVGLAAPQVGENIQLFVINPTGEPGDDRVYVNPQLSEPTGGEEESEEGCLSLPEVRAEIWRTKKIQIDAQDLEGRPFRDTESGFIARIWQHELDHLNGTLITDRMGALAKMAVKKKLRELEEIYAKAHPKAKATRRR